MTRFLFPAVRVFALALQELAQRWNDGEREDPPLAVLRRARLAPRSPCE